MSRKTRQLTDDEREVIAAARDKAYVLYEGKQVPHHSCGIALAATFGLATAPYQSLRKGGITGCGQCGAVRAGEHVLGELLGDPDPTGSVTDELRDAITWYQDEVERRVDKGEAQDLVCNHLTGQFGDFHGQERKQFCTDMAACMAGLTAESLIRFGKGEEPLAITPIGSVEEDS